MNPDPRRAVMAIFTVSVSVATADGDLVERRFTDVYTQ